MEVDLNGRTPPPPIGGENPTDPIPEAFCIESGVWSTVGKVQSCAFNPLCVQSIHYLLNGHITKFMEEYFPIGIQMNW